MEEKLYESINDIEIISNARLIEETLETRGWKEIIEPLIDMMISNVIGYKEDGRWVKGMFDNFDLSEANAQNLIWYKQALVHLHQQIYSYLDAAKGARERQLDKSVVKEEYTTPMLDSKYSSTRTDDVNYYRNQDREGGIL